MGLRERERGEGEVNREESMSYRSEQSDSGGQASSGRPVGSVTQAEEHHTSRGASHKQPDTVRP